jgi:hypothetical protein
MSAARNMAIEHKVPVEFQLGNGNDPIGHKINFCEVRINAQSLRRVNLKRGRRKVARNISKLSKAPII